MDRPRVKVSLFDREDIDIFSDYDVLVTHDEAKLNSHVNTLGLARRITDRFFNVPKNCGEDARFNLVFPTGTSPADWFQPPSTPLISNFHYQLRELGYEPHSTYTGDNCIRLNLRKKAAMNWFE